MRHFLPVLRVHSPHSCLFRVFRTFSETFEGFYGGEADNILSSASTKSLQHQNLEERNKTVIVFRFWKKERFREHSRTSNHFTTDMVNYFLGNKILN